MPLRIAGAEEEANKTRLLLERGVLGVFVPQLAHFPPFFFPSHSLSFLPSLGAVGWQLLVATGAELGPRQKRTLIGCPGKAAEDNKASSYMHVMPLK